MRNAINVAVIGAGYWGPNLVRNFHSLPGCNMRAVCDSDSKRLAHIRTQYPDVLVTTDFNQLVEDPEIDAVAIATPVHTHFPLAQRALEAGKHTFIEKPMASSVAECQQLIESARMRNLTLMIGHTYIYSTPVRTIKSIIDSGDLGEILYISSNRLNLGLFQSDINVTWDLAPHDLSIVHYLLGESPISLNCQGKAHLRNGIEDVTTLSLNYEDQEYAVFHYSWLDPNKVREMKIVGSKRMIVYDDTQPLEKIKIYDKRVETPPFYDTFAEFQYSYHYGDMYCPYLKQVEPLKTETQHFIDCIQTGEKPLSSGIEGLRVIQILEASSESLKKDGTNVALEYSETAPVLDNRNDASNKSASYAMERDRSTEKAIAIQDHGLVIQSSF